jgi:hypothetical protein
MLICHENEAIIGSSLMFVLAYPHYWYGVFYDPYIGQVKHVNPKHTLGLVKGFNPWTFLQFYSILL